MAVNSFKIGKTYRVRLQDISSMDILYCKNLTIYFSNIETKAVFKGKVQFYENGSGTWEVYDGQGRFLMNTDDGHDVSPAIWCEFVACSDTNESDETWFDSAQLISDNFAQVSVYNEYSSQWVDLPCASEYTGIATTIVDSGRNASGVVIADPIASDVAKVELKWNFLTLEQYSMIAQLFEPKYNGAFMNAVRFFDVVKGDFDGDNTQSPNTTTNRCRVMYCGDRKVSFAKMKLDDDGRPIGYQGVSLNLIDTHKIYGE